MTTHEPSPATRDYTVWADRTRRVYQIVQAASPEEAYRLAKERPDDWEPCVVHEGNRYHLSNDVEDSETQEVTRVGRPPSHCDLCGMQLDPWNFGMPLEEALEHRLAEVRERAALKQNLDRYHLMLPEEKIRLAMDILWDVADTWDEDSLEQYPQSCRASTSTSRGSEARSTTSAGIATALPEEKRCRDRR